MENRRNFLFLACLNTQIYCHEFKVFTSCIDTSFFDNCSYYDPSVERFDNSSTMGRSLTFYFSSLPSWGESLTNSFFDFLSLLYLCT
jgi:hypothetical protein